jgi:hypothetical protein
MLGFLYMSRQDYTRAREVLERGLYSSRLIGEKRGVCVNASNLGHVCAREGRFDEAFRLQREALVLAHELYDLQGLGAIVLEVAGLAIATGVDDVAVTLLGAATRLAETTEFALHPFEVELFDEMLGYLRARESAADLERRLDAGRGMTVDDLVGYALSFADSRTPSPG